MKEKTSGATARVPLRISFAGGGTDVSPYPELHGGAVACSTIQTYVHADVWSTDKNYVEVRSIDTGTLIRLDNENSSVNTSHLLSESIKEVRKSDIDGFSVAVRSTVPPGSGLGASSAISLAILGAMKEYSGQSYDRQSLAKAAYRVEREVIDIAGGYQDQYACSFGGFNLLEFGKNGTCKQTPLKMNDAFIAEFEHDLLLFWVGGTRMSDGIIRDQTNNFKSGITLDTMHQQKSLAFQMAAALTSSNMLEIGALLNQGWELKKRYSKMITNSTVDFAYSEALNTGAIGGKLLGAGGGGFLLLLAKRHKRHLVVDRLRELGLMEYPLIFDSEGAKVWKTINDAYQI